MTERQPLVACALLLFGCGNAPPRVEPAPEVERRPSVEAPRAPAIQEERVDAGCSGKAFALDEIFVRGGCETTDAPEQAALRDPIDAHIETSVAPATWEAVPREVVIPSRDGVRQFVVKFTNMSTRTIALYFRFNPKCSAADWAGRAALGVRYRVFDAQGAVVTGNPRQCAVEPGPLRTVRLSLEAGGAATLTTSWGPELVDRSDQYRALKPGTYELRIATPLVGVSDVGRERTFVRVAVVVPEKKK